MDPRELKRLLKVLGGGPRLEILTILKKRQSATVGEIAEAIHRSPNTTSLHLSTLASLRIIIRRRRDKFVFYRLSLPQDPLVRHVVKML